MLSAATRPSSPVKQLRRALRRRWLLVIVAAIVLAWLVLIARDALALRADWQALQADLEALDTASLDLPRLHQRVASMRDNLAALRSHAGPLVSAAPALGWLPGIGGDVRSAPALLDMAAELLEGGERALSALAPLWPPIAGEGESAIESIVRGLDAARPDLLAVQEHVERAIAIRQQIDASRLSDSVRSLLDRFDRAVPLLRTGAALLPLVPQLLGVDRSRTYLILIQNEDELRPTGGFLSAVARVTLDAGRIVTMTVSDAYTVDDFSKPYGDPPAPLRDYMGSELWVFRDSNWSPDFPTSARKAIELYTYTQGGRIDGAIALNQHVVEAVVAGLGSISIVSGDPPVTADTIRAYMRSAWAPSDQVDAAQWLEERKDFMSRLAQAVLDRVLNSGDQTDWPALGRALLGVLRSRDLQVYLVDDSLAQPIARAGWAGAVRPTDGDYLMVVDANLGFNKVNALMHQSIAYSVTLGADRSSTAELEVDYAHSGAAADGCVHAVPSYGLDVTYEALIQQCYWDYQRVLVPAGAELIDATHYPIGADQLITRRAFDGVPLVAIDLDKTVFETMLLVERGQRRETRLRYALPQNIIKMDDNRGVYHLLIQKQPGAGIWPVSVTVVWPAGWQLAQSDPEPSVTNGDSAMFQMQLDADREVVLGFDLTP